MADPQGLFSFPGIFGIKSGQYTCAHGINPGRIILTAAAQQTPPANVGDLVMTYGSTVIAARDCKVIEVITTEGDDGHETEYTLEDHRWRWRFGEIEGHYNRRLADGSIESSSFRTTQELATKLLQAMKVQNYDVSQLPETGFPEVEWYADNPAQELEKLANDFGCRVVYDPVQHYAVLAPTGVGVPLPQLPQYISGNFTLTRPAVPSAVRVVGGVTRVQTRLALKAVGREPDGTVKDIDDLEYAPDDNWANYAAGLSNVSNEAARKSYQETVFKWYKIDLENNPVTIQSEGFSFVVDSNKKVDDIRLELNEKYTDSVTGEERKEGHIEGTFWDRRTFTPGNVPTNTSTSRNDVRVSQGYTLDGDIVKFSDVIYKIKDGATAGNYEAEGAELELTCTFAIRNHGDTGSLHRFSYFQQVGTDGAVIGPKVLLRDELVWKITDTNSSSENNPALFGFPIWESNRASANLDEHSLGAIGAELEKYQIRDAGDAYYSGFIPYSLDGAIQTVVWRFSERGAFTEIYRNSEPDYIQSKYDRRYQLNEIKRKLSVDS